MYMWELWKVNDTMQLLLSGGYHGGQAHLLPFPTNRTFNRCMYSFHKSTNFTKLIL